ncbi:MAG: hypothetical protein EBY41_03090 [Proteobacteria bacterium]|jgi:hypothetical protein|nr:hypothetical protein [Pseudomonadota bacterium]
MPQQLEFVFGPRDATPEEQKEWIETEGTYWAETTKKLIVWLSILQVSLVGFMLTCMAIIEYTIAK